ncbi:unnamed protein product [Anisakis simplex]|uniref:TMF_TATA_bd domain-containing protein n=1 Tax=Anisakis simplex TaxID=6269 RepID=A0A158PPE9_ANISI|nr:unnamed protein product [Anisakis simplex]
MNFTWANQLAKNALRNAQKRIDSVLDITPEEESDDDNEENDNNAKDLMHSNSDNSNDQKGIQQEDVVTKSNQHQAVTLYSQISDVATNVSCEKTEWNCGNATDLTEDSCSLPHQHDDTVTISSSDIEVLRQGDSWSLMSVPTSTTQDDAPILRISESISLEPFAQQQLPAVMCEEDASSISQMRTEIAQLRSQIQHQERRIGDLLAQNQRLEKKSHDLLALKAARNKQSSAETKLIKKLSEKESELASLLQEGKLTLIIEVTPYSVQHNCEKLAETNGKLTKELKRLRTSLAEQDQLAKKGAQAEIDRDLANEQVRGLNAENAKLRVTIKTLEEDCSRMKAADEILVNDLKRRDERIEKLTAHLQTVEKDKDSGFEEVKRLSEIMDVQRDAAQMVAMANSPLLESIRQLESDAKSKEVAHEASINEKDLIIASLTKTKDELLRRNSELIDELSEVRSENDEANVMLTQITQQLNSTETQNRSLQSSLDRSERLIEGLRISLQSKEVEIDKFYVRLREEAENAERQSVEKQKKIEKLTSECSDLNEQLSLMRERINDEGESSQIERKNSEIKLKTSFSSSASSNKQASLPYMSSSNAAQIELADIIMKYEQSMRQVSSLEAKLASMQEDNKMLVSLKKKYQDLNERYENLLEAHGEKIERIEELELDIADVKKLFRDQMELLLGKN